MKNALFLLFLFIVMSVYGDAYAGDASPIFDTLANKAGAVGKGLRNTGFLIAGFGLIVFSFMAIFNKISWKMLAYIMFSTFILSTMTGIISYISDGKAVNRFPDVQSTGPGSESMDTTKAQVGKEDGNPSLAQGTGGELPKVGGAAGGGAAADGVSNAGVETVPGQAAANAGEEQAANAGTGATQEQASQQSQQDAAEAAKEKLEESVKGKLPRTKIGNNIVAGPRTPEALISTAKLKDVETAVAEARKNLEQWEKLSEEEKKTDYAQELRNQYMQTISAGQARLESGKEFEEYKGPMIRVKMPDGSYEMRPANELNLGRPAN